MTTLAIQLTDSSRWQKARRLRNYLLLSLAVGGVTFYALAWFIGHYRVLGNETDSLSERFYLMERNRDYRPLVRGSYLAFHIGTIQHYPAGMIFVKTVVGLPGDVIQWDKDEVYVAGHRVGLAKRQNRFGDTMQPFNDGKDTIIPPNHYFVATDHPDSYDSRYADLGLVSGNQIAGEVVVAW